MQTVDFDKLYEMALGVAKPRTLTPHTEVGAVGAALLTDSGSTVVKNEFDYDDGKGVYEIELVQNNVQYEFEIDATTGAVLAQSQEHR